MKQPRALYLLNFVSMWECFSYYGMRVLLVLFLIHEMRMSDHAAFGLYALYTTLIEFGGLIGGIVADRFLGLKRSIALGAYAIAVGHLFLALGHSETPFFWGLGMIVMGTSLFRSNVAALLGEFYQGEDARREVGYTLYYTGINIGGFLASLACGFVGEIYGWHAGFSLAAIGMILGNIVLLLAWKTLAGKGESNASHQTNTLVGLMGASLLIPFFAVALYYHTIIAPMVPFAMICAIGFVLWKTKDSTPDEIKKLGRLGLYVISLIIFFACEEQLGSTLMLFSERHIDRNLMGWGLIPTASLIMFNPLTILLTGPLLAKVMQRVPLRSVFKIGLSFLLLGLAFCVLCVGCLFNDHGSVSLISMIGSIILIALGEIFIGPTVYAYAASVAPSKYPGLTMGLVTIGYAMANFFSGWLSQWLIVVEESSSIDTYSWGFGVIGLSVLVLSLALFFINHRLNGSYYDTSQVCQ